MLDSSEMGGCRVRTNAIGALHAVVLFGVDTRPQDHGGIQELKLFADVQ